MDVKKMASMGQKAMREQQSAAEKVFWPLQAGRPRQLKPSLLEAIQAGRSVANRLYGAVRDSGLRIKDAGCVLICTTDGGSLAKGMGAFAPENEDSNDLEMALKILNGGAVPIGVGFLLLDREKGNVLMHGRPFEPIYKRHVELVVEDWAFAFKKESALEPV